MGARELAYVLRGLQLAMLLVVLVLCAGFVWFAAISVSKSIFGGSDGLVILAGTVTVIGLIAIMLWVQARFVMILPAAANGDDSTFDRSDSLTRHHYWHIIGIEIITSALSFLASFVVVFLIAFFLMLAQVMAAEGARVIGTVIGVWIATLLNATYLGCVYRRLIGSGNSG